MQANEHRIGHNIILSLQEQWSGEYIYEIHKMHKEKCLGTNYEVILTLLQITSTPIGTWLPSPAMLLLNRPIRGLLPEVNIEPINIYNDDAQYEAL